MRYLAQPLYPNTTAASSEAVQIYSLPASGTGAAAQGLITLPPDLTPTGATVQGWLGNPNALYAGTANAGATTAGANGALVYQDPSTGDNSMFVVYNFGFNSTNFSISLSSGVICIYNLADLVPTLSPTAAPKAYILLPNGPIGIALQPGSGDLYIATDSGGYSAKGGGNGGVYTVPKPAPGWSSLSSSSSAPTIPTQVLSQNSQGTLQVCANLAFDLHGNLWMTVIGSPSGDTSGTPGNGLACILIPGNTLPYPTLYFTDTPAANPTLTATLTPTLPSTPLTGSGATPLLYAFSAPEGLAFDPDGNLWICNNNEVYLDDVNPKVGGYYGSGGGSLLMLSSAWLYSNIYPTPNSAANSASGGLPITADLVASGDATTYWYNADAQFGGIVFDGHTMYLNDEGHKTVWSSSVENAAISNFQASGITTTNPGNGTASIFSYPYPNPTLTIRDIVGPTGTDTGQQPDIAIPGGANGTLWESPDILVYPTNQTPSSFPQIDTLIPSSTATPDFTGSGTVPSGTGATIYVRVTNNSTTTPSNGTEILKLYWGFASTGLSWPQPWDGSLFLPGTTIPKGGVIGEVELLTPIQPAGSGQDCIYIPVDWPASALDALTNAAYLTAAGGDVVQAGHFCLLARIEANALYPFGMYSPELIATISDPSAIHTNTYNNSAIAWRNIEVTGGSSGVVVGPYIKVHVLGANYGAAGHFSFGVETLNGKGEPSILHQKIYVNARGAALTRLLEAQIDETRLKPVEPVRPVESVKTGRFELLDIAAGLHRIHLPSRELLPFDLEFHPQPGLEHFALRVTQYFESEQGQKVVGGQTFVHGRVLGLNAF